MSLLFVAVKKQTFYSQGLIVIFFSKLRKEGILLLKKEVEFRPQNSLKKKTKNKKHWNISIFYHVIFTNLTVFYLDWYHQKVFKQKND